jgi:hypothetical protein
MYEGARVMRKGYGAGTVVYDFKCNGPKGDTYLLFIRFDDSTEPVSMYDDEVEIKHDS